jgi:hypothetical protein
MIIPVADSEFSFRDAFDVSQECQSIQAFLGLITVLQRSFLIFFTGLIKLSLISWFLIT